MIRAQVDQSDLAVRCKQRLPHYPLPGLAARQQAELTLSVCAPEGWQLRAMGY